jgi:hypothetical protein
LGDPKIFRGQVGRKIWEVREVNKFVRSRGLEGLGWRKDPLSGNKWTFATSCSCVSYHSSDYCTERFVHCITLVLHVVQIHINICIYYSVVHHVSILDKNLSGTRTQLLYFHLNGMTRIGWIGSPEGLGCYEGQDVLEVNQVGNFGSLGRLNIFRGQGGRQILEVMEVGKFGR